MLINYWYDKNVLPYFETLRSKKIYKEYKRTELVILMLIKEKGKSEPYLNELNDIRIKLERFKHEKFYTKNIMSIND